MPTSMLPSNSPTQSNYPSVSPSAAPSDSSAPSIYVSDIPTSRSSAPSKSPSVLSSEAPSETTSPSVSPSAAPSDSSAPSKISTNLCEEDVTTTASISSGDVLLLASEGSAQYSSLPIHIISAGDAVVTFYVLQTWKSTSSLGWIAVMFESNAGGS